MKTLAIILFAGSILMVPVIAAQPEGPTYKTVPPKVRFVWLPVYVDSADMPLAAYQFELKATQGDVTIVGVEGGQHAAFKKPPYYDPAVLKKENRIIIAAFNVGNDLPAGKNRIASVHLMVEGEIEPEYKIELTVAADPNGKKIPNAKINLKKGNTK